MKRLLLIPLVLFLSCDDDDDSDCVDSIEVDTVRGACNVNLDYQNEVSFSTSGNSINITSNNIPDHNVGLFGNVSGALNPNAITPQNSTYELDAAPTKALSITELSNDNGPLYAFGIMINGVELDPVAAEPWPHSHNEGPPTGDDVNWDWNLEASMVQIGLDCNNAHVQPTGKYHHHGVPTLYLESLINDEESMIHLGYAADGFPIYYKNGYSIPNDTLSALIDLESSFRLKTGIRPGDGSSVPCDEYSGVYTADYEYIEGLGDLDECNGRDGVTKEFPNGTYYYIITDEYPGIPRCFVGAPSDDFRLGGGGPPLSRHPYHQH